jgi:hypothetical protein
MEQTGKYGLYHLTFKCDLDLGGSNLHVDFEFSRLSHGKDYLCQVILKPLKSGHEK